jgi:hypothetical protein
MDAFFVVVLTSVVLAVAVLVLLGLHRLGLLDRPGA